MTTHPRPHKENTEERQRSPTPSCTTAAVMKLRIILGEFQMQGCGPHGAATQPGPADSSGVDGW